MAKAGKSNFEWEIINRVKEFRIQKSLSQYDIALILGTSSSFIGQVEIQSHSSKYNLDHLNRLAHEWNCSPREFLPHTAISEKDWDEF